MTFLRDAWYLAAWAEELAAGSLLSRTICGEPLVFYRSPEGTAAALLDRCPHRFAPLSRGKLDGAVLRCGYHGLAFGPDGICVGNPHGPVSRSVRTRSFAAVERHGAIWVWMGDAPRPDAAQIPDYGFIDRTAQNARVTGYLRTDANYLLMVDNILDLTHADYLHPDTLGGGINTRAKGSVATTSDGVSITWRADDEALPPVMGALLPGTGGRGDFRNEVYWSPPGNMRQRLLFGPPGRLTENGLDSWTAHVMTPESATSTHYFFCHTSDSLNANPALAPHIKEVLLCAFRDQDAPMLEAQQSRLQDADFWSLSPALLAIDKGAVAARRMLEQRLAAEAKVT
jgi:phenylpropionate dioxygenase-like ring-hydroxylating dioxygenase large terminal subunit